MRTLKNITFGAILLVMAGLMLMFGVLAWISKHIYACFVAITYKIANDALDLINKYYLEKKEENPYVKLLK